MLYVYRQLLCTLSSVNFPVLFLAWFWHLYCKLYSNRIASLCTLSIHAVWRIDCNLTVGDLYIYSSQTMRSAMPYACISPVRSADRSRTSPLRINIAQITTLPTASGKSLGSQAAILSILCEIQRYSLRIVLATLIAVTSINAFNGPLVILR